MPSVSNIIFVAIVFGNFALAVSTFVLLGKPSQFESLMARLTGEHEDLLYGRLSDADRHRLQRLGYRLGILGLGLLFVWSFCTGLLLRWQEGTI